MSDYKKTLQLPKTSFPMKANLKQREPEMLARWDKEKAYESMVASAPDPGKRYVLHDGPPYANGNIHMGTALNKVLKDIIVKSKNMAGYKAEYVPGWDCHGLPIEHKVDQELKAKGKDLPPLAVRKVCRDYAAKFVDVMRKEFKRLGVFGVWEEPYLTMNPAYEAATAGVLTDFMRSGALTRAKKPIYWCMDCKTALAEAEVEYADHVSPSIHVAFPLPDAKLSQVLAQADPARAHIVIWTTTPWTIPDNMAVAVHPDFAYVLVEHGGGQYLWAKDLLETCLKAFGWEEGSYRILSECEGRALEGLVARHPFYDRDSRVVLADYVTLDAGTGCVHTAPGHGADDYATGLRYGLEVYSPMDDAGRFFPTVEFFGGLSVTEANPKVIEKLEEVGRLLAKGAVDHSYPHCWRCKRPVIYRATTQWFISMAAGELRQKALKSIVNDVTWIPAWGRERIYNMIENRPDWCVSRQRVWGVPIVALLCKGCGEAYYDADWAKAITDRFADYKTGCDYWFETPLEDLVPQGLTCACGSTGWEKETDILDVWFDSGTSFAAVVEQRPECRFPADMYLEGSDQHRGWFHSSLLACLGSRGVAPYKEVLTHGYVVDARGLKMSKSVGNVVAPGEIIDKYGAEILRMWAASVDYREDIRISDEIMDRTVDAYRRIRNTCRFILGNLADFTPADAVAVADMLPLDRHALDLCARAHEKNQDAYAAYEFHKVFHALHNLCVTDLSAFYLDVVKDRLYVMGAASRERRSAQTALWRILTLMLTDMAPVMSFTAEEALGHMPEALKPGVATVFELKALSNDELDGLYLDLEGRELWDKVLKARAAVTRAIEPRRKAGELGHSLEAAVTLYAGEGLREALSTPGLDLAELCIVSQARVAPRAEAPEDAFAAEDLDLAVAVAKASGDKCPRCWTFDALGQNPAHPDLCPRCAGVMTETGADG